MSPFNASSIFEISYSKESPKTCLGVFAKRDIQAGEIILQEKKILKDYAHEKGCGPSSRLLRDFEKLTEEDRAMVLSLNAHVDTELQLQIESAATTDPESRLEHIRLISVMRANSVPIDEPYGKITLMGLFPVFSSFSHSCVFNANHTFDYPGGREYEVTVQARAAIAKGEEITVGHITPWVADREARIEKRYGTKCRCKLCGPVGLGGDKRSKTLDSFQQIIDTQVEKPGCTSWSMPSNFKEMQRCMARVVAHEFLGPSPALVEEYSALACTFIVLGKTSFPDRYWQAVTDSVNVARLCFPPNHHTLKSVEERLFRWKKVD